MVLHCIALAVVVVLLLARAFPVSGDTVGVQVTGVWGRDEEKEVVEISLQKFRNDSGGWKGSFTET